MNAPALKTRKPTGIVPWPLILVEGAEKSGKSWAAAVLSASPKVGRTFWIDLGEGAGDEYGAIPGVRYEIVEHDGTWPQILGSVQAIHDLAKATRAKGEPPVVLVIDSMTAVWDMLKDWISNRARKTQSNQKLLRADPNAEINITGNFWNDANDRHRKLMNLLMTFPGIAVMTARGKEVTAMTNGQPDPRKPTEYRVEAQKWVPADSSVWVRLARGEDPLIVGVRGVQAGLENTGAQPVRKPGLTLESLVFDVLKCDTATAHVRDLVELKPGDLDPEGRPPAEAERERGETPAVSARARELAAQITAAGDKDALSAAWAAIASAVKADEISKGEADKLADRWKARKAEVVPAPIAENQKKHLYALWNQAGYSDDRDARLAYTADVIGREVASWNDLTAADHQLMVAKIQAFIDSIEGAPAGVGVPA